MINLYLDSYIWLEFIKRLVFDIPHAVPPMEKVMIAKALYIKNCYIRANSNYNLLDSHNFANKTFVNSANA